MQQPEITITGAQLRDALICICGEDPETEATLAYRDAFTSDEGEAMPAGLYGYITEYPEEGLVGPLGFLTPNGAKSESPN